MTTDIYREYYIWLCNQVMDKPMSESQSYGRLLWRLFTQKFTWTFRSDADRAQDGMNLRKQFAATTGRSLTDIFEEPCNILEMMVALAQRCESQIMSNPEIGDRSGQWFWTMIASMGLGRMTDDCYRQKYVEETIYNFLEHRYMPNGEGGLFTVHSATEDLRQMSIWSQMNLYLLEILQDEGSI